MTSSDGSFCLPVCVCVCVFYMCIYREQCLSYFTRQVEQLIGDSVSQSFILIYLLSVFIIIFLFFGACVCLTPSSKQSFCLTLDPPVASSSPAAYAFNVTPQATGLAVCSLPSSPHVTVLLYPDAAQQTLYFVFQRVFLFIQIGKTTKQWEEKSYQDHMRLEELSKFNVC